MPNAPVRSPGTPQPSAVCPCGFLPAVCPCGFLDALVADARGGSWAPTPLERRIAGLLAAAAAGDGLLTADRVRAALWEGSLALVQENDGRLARLLAGLLSLPVVYGGYGPYGDVPYGQAPYGDMPYGDVPDRDSDAARQSRRTLDAAYGFVVATASGHAY
ncbi:hypothetical protein PUR49_07060 [Streptomyces sp. BE147]|uniref:hypothetical protein n=1 Tax=Streptomyces sp. BE147 TaxID=3002524 RepID=UPI002E77F3D8|nr:hypothetical protein [Streptomyces sp. BE147]MEE1736260.1 hypothetical protein [Streptomyces sp. BE147]